ncbi:SRPBCC family protein [Cohnella lubricantis]|uniref:SRPBCC family protein n=1 Tax=Cohnella lubricantis TaxID=2163172 RepID=A0A841T9Z2_9BACL|nr:SRPBCC family protein [Cohnella lubricantis]MBB6676080.1 SRPBCC family protein [Cohnella lubricantis]MBP2118035.1 hypothetical protein [Cohnella lubricantis]
MVRLHESKMLRVVIERQPDEVYEYAVNPERLPEWAASFALAVRKEGDEWIVDTPEGPMKVEFAERNAYGILDHYVTVAPGIRVLNPMRVIPNGMGSEVIFTFFKPDEMPMEQFELEAANVLQDLHSLKRVLEQQR